MALQGDGPPMNADERGWFDDLSERVLGASVLLWNVLRGLAGERHFRVMGR